MRYLFITEDNEVYQADDVKDEEKVAADDGLWTIIDIQTMTDYYQGAWYDIVQRIEE